MKLSLPISLILVLLCLTTSAQASDEPLLLIDTHIHYSHDAWQRLPPEQALEILKQAGLKRAFVSRSSDEGTQKLYQLAPDFIVPVLRPYRKRGELASWMHDDSVPGMLSRLLSKNSYAGIGEFHAFGSDIRLPVLQRVIELARGQGIFLHAHADAEAIRLIFETNPDALVVWAHSGFESPDDIQAMLQRYPNLWADLAFRYEHEAEGVVEDNWARLFNQFPQRFMLGTDTYTPERWYYVIDQAASSRQWLSSLPTELANNIAWRNAESLLQRVLKK